MKSFTTAQVRMAMADTKYEGFTDEEREAMKEAGPGAGSQQRAGPRGKKDEEGTVLEKIADMSEPDRGLATRLHEIIKANAPVLTPRLYYGMPAYAKDGKVLCFFQPVQKLKRRYATLGFNDTANIHDGTMCPTSFALTELRPTTRPRSPTS